MRICVPTLGEKGLEDEVFWNFGLSPTFTFVELDSGDVSVVQGFKDGCDGSRITSEIIMNSDVSAVVCSSISAFAAERLMKFGISVYIGAKGKVRDAVEAFKAGRLLKLEKAACVHATAHDECAARRQEEHACFEKWRSK